MKRTLSAVVMTLLVLFAVSGSVYAAPKADTLVKKEVIHEVTYANMEVIRVSETIENNAGKRFKLEYDATIEWPETDAEILAKFLNHEGGTPEEKELIAGVVAARMESEEFPDSVKGVITQKNWFFINPTFWNSMIKPTDDEITFAEEILANPKEEAYLYYTFKQPGLSGMLDVIRSNYDVYEKENYLFYR